MLFNTLAEVEENTLGDTLDEMEVEALVKTLAYHLAQVEKALALVDGLDDKLANIETKRLGKTPGDVKKQALVNTLANRLALVEAKALGNTLNKVEAKALVDMLADTLVAVNGETVIDTLSDVLAPIVVDT